jgi:hypothetical protein
LRRFIRSFGIVQSASLKLISLHVALVSSLYRCCAGDVTRIPRNKVHWAWVRDGQNCSMIECHASALPGHGEVRKSAVSLLADDEVLSDDKIAANARVHTDPEEIRTGAGNFSIDARLGLPGAPPRRTQAPLNAADRTTSAKRLISVEVARAQVSVRLEPDLSPTNRLDIKDKAQWMEQPYGSAPLPYRRPARPIRPAPIAS